MPKSKEQCPSCCTYTISFTSDNCDYIEEIRKQYRLKGRSKPSVEKMANKIFSEHRFAKDNDATFRHYNQFFCKSETMCADRELNGFPNSKCNACDKYSKV